MINDVPFVLMVKYLIKHSIILDLLVEINDGRDWIMTVDSIQPVESLISEPLAICFSLQRVRGILMLFNWFFLLIIWAICCMISCI